MALDGIFLSRIKDEIAQRVIDFRVEKVQQPTRDEIILVFRGRGGAYRLLICVRSDSPRVHFTEHQVENPAAPPMFCMLLRKHLTSAKLTAVRQQGLDRLLFLEFDGTNEIGDRVALTLCVEIMGTYSNLILIGENGKIIDAAKRIDFAASSVRQILPGLPYVLPAPQDKLNLEENDVSAILARMEQTPNKLLSGALMNAVQGISPIIAREVMFRAAGEDLPVNALSESARQKLQTQLQKIKDGLHRDSSVCMVLDESDTPKELAFLEILQYGTARKTVMFDSASELLDRFFAERDRAVRLHARGKEMLRTLGNLTDRTARKLTLQKKELAACADRETLRLYGELITANLHALEKGSVFFDVPNYYDNMQTVRIPADPALSPKENANRYYRDYRKAKTAEGMLTKLIEQGEEELTYFASVLDALSRADTQAELDAIRAELTAQGYLKARGGKKQKAPKALPPLEFRTSDGYRVLVGRNNEQNDRLSLKTANKSDLWLHTQGFPGSHVILETGGAELPDKALEEAAVIAATHSKAADSSLVPVDYTPVKKLKKPNGAKPGKVIYHEYFTIMVKPDKALCERLKTK